MRNGQDPRALPPAGSGEGDIEPPASLRRREESWVPGGARRAARSEAAAPRWVLPVPRVADLSRCTRRVWSAPHDPPGWAPRRPARRSVSPRSKAGPAARLAARSGGRGEAPSGRDEVLTRERSFLRPPRPPAPRRAARPPPAPPRETGITVRRDERRQCGAGRRFGEAARLGGNAPLRREKETPSAGPEASASRATCEQARCEPVMILPQVHLRKPCYDFYFL
ncbi:MAG: hypothetical protein CL912_29900 [Deltaproteobacteria bacterium]|nr:hypothetical protein [Deltaproteobacteria bacterium]